MNIWENRTKQAFSYIQRQPLTSFLHQRSDHVFDDHLTTTRLPCGVLGSLNFPTTQDSGANRTLFQALDWLGANEGKTIFALVPSRFFLRSPPTNREPGTGHGNRALGRSPNKLSSFSQKLPWEIFLRRLCSACANRRCFRPIPYSGAFARACDHLSGMNLGCQIIDASWNVLSELE